MRGTTRLNWFLILICWLSFLAPGYAEDRLSNNPPPESAAELVDEFDTAFPEVKAPRETRLDSILERSRLTLRLRNYYFDRDKPNSSDSTAWAQGGSIEYKLDRVAGLLDFNAEYFTSYRLYGPDNRDGTLILQPDQESIDTLGILNGKINYADQVLSGYRQRYDLPFLNSQDNRMIPNTFEGYTLAMTKETNKTFQYVVGYVDRIKTRNQDTFVSMSDAAGVSSKENGVVLGGFRFYPIPELSVGFIDLYLNDIYNTDYAQIDYKVKYSELVANALSIQYGNQISVGDDLLRGEGYSTSMWGIQDSVSYGDFLVKLAYTQTDSGADFRSPFGSYAGFNSVIVQDFNRAGEGAWQLGGTYDFSRVLLNGLSLTAGYVNGSGAIDESSKQTIAQLSETDVTLDYRIKEGWLKNFWFRSRAGIVDSDHGGTTKDYRIIVNYEIPLYEPPQKS